MARQSRQSVQALAATQREEMVRRVLVRERHRPWTLDHCVEVLLRHFVFSPGADLCAASRLMPCFRWSVALGRLVDSGSR